MSVVAFLVRCSGSFFAEGFKLADAAVPLHLTVHVLALTMWLFLCCKDVVKPGGHPIERKYETKKDK